MTDKNPNLVGKEEIGPMVSIPIIPVIAIIIAFLFAVFLLRSQKRKIDHSFQSNLPMEVYMNNSQYTWTTNTNGDIVLVVIFYKNKQ